MTDQAYDRVREKILDAQRKRVKHIDLSNNQLTALPSEVVQLKALQSLDLRGNRLTALRLRSGS